MRIYPLAALACFLATAAPSVSRAGLYYLPPNKALWPENFAYPMPSGGYKPQQFRSLLNDLRTIAVDRGGLEGQEGKKSLRQQYLDRAVDLTAKGTALTVPERLELSVCQMRLLKPDEALNTLRPAEAAEPRNFMVLANLATTHQMSNLFDRAIFYEEQALANWPSTYEGSTPEQLRWHRRVEKYHLLLMQQRLREEQAQPGKTAEDVDNLFPKFRFQNNKEPYQAGLISPERWAELPGDAIPIVQQLLIWMPHDNRLYWLLGELLNARGDPADARDVLDDLEFGRRYTPTDLIRKHLRVLPTHPDPPTADGLPASVPGSASANWLPDWRHILVGFVAGVIVTLLIQMQWHEFARRRQLRNAIKPPVRP